MARLPCLLNDNPTPDRDHVVGSFFDHLYDGSGYTVCYAHHFFPRECGVDIKSAWATCGDILRRVYARNFMA